jgi:hypothetical protein
VSEKKISFNIHENIQKIHESIKGKSRSCFERERTDKINHPQNTHIAHTDPLEKEIAELAESIFDVKAQQEYIVVRERQHRDSKF